MKELPDKISAELPRSLPPVKRDPIVLEQASDDDDKVAARFKAYAMEKYDDLFEELEFRCQRAAMMHYHMANIYSRKCYYTELAAAMLGAVSVSSIGTVLLKWNSSNDLWSVSTSKLGYLGVLGIFVAFVLEFASKGSTKIIPTFSKRCDRHKKAAVGWQRLTRLTRSYRIQLRNPALLAEDYTAWYASLVNERQLVSAIALVPSHIYRAFNDPARVFASLKRRRQMFLRYQQMFEGSMEVRDDYDDD